MTNFQLGIINQRNLKIVLFILAISFTNLWIYRILQNNLLIGTLVLGESILLFLSIFPKTSKYIYILMFVIMFILSIYLLKNHFDKSIFKMSDAEISVINRRQEFFSNGLGKIYRNRAGIFYFNNLRLYFNKINNKLFSNLDLGLYFSPGNNRYSIFFVIPFVSGFIYLLINIKKYLITNFLLALFIGTLINLDYDINPVLLFPFINLCIAIGLNQIIKIIK